MKPFNTFLSVLLGLTLISAEAEARGEGKRSGGGGGGRQASAPSRSAPKRSPMTGSKVERPAARPAPKPASRPSPQPASRPDPKPAPKPVQRPSVQKPAGRPDTGPANKPGDNRPDVGRPDKPDNGRPEINRPDNKPDRPDNKPGRPAARPDNNRPDVNRPGDNRPGNNGPGENRPDTKPMPRPDRPDKNKPATLPGMVTYPDRPGKDKPNRPGLDNRPDNGNRPNRPDGPGRPNGPDGANRPDIANRPDRDRPDRDGPDRVNIGNSRDRLNIDNSRDRNRFDNSKNVHIDKVNINRRNNGLNRPGTRPAGKRDWDNNKWGGNRGVWGNNVNIQNNIHIDNNFRHNNNFSYRPNYWGGRPWWGAGDSHSWHHGHWNYGWNSHYYHSHWYYDDDNFASGFMWGIAVWSLGNMVYDMGYHTYTNPYPAPPVQYNDSKSTISYNQPISVTAAEAPPGDEETTKIAETKSADAVDQSRDSFKQRDYVAALKSCDEAIAYTPGDVTLHEYRSLVLFALGRYSDAAGVINPVLASGPGWGWDTMVGFYDSSSTYDGQLRKLEDYVKGKPEGADGHFLLGYHYMVSGHMDTAYVQFEKTAKLQPADSIAVELRNLTKSSLPDDGDDDTPEPTPPAPVPTEKLVGTWVVDQGSGGKITFKMEESGDFVWSFANGDKSSELKGTYGLNDKGLLVLTTEDSQMVSVVSLPQDSQLKFTLVGSPGGDPGLDFKKS